MNSNSKLPIIKPKTTIKNDFIISKIQVSKNWKLPPLASSSSSSIGTIRKHTVPIEETLKPANSSEMILLKKQRQNRDAQRAYRERKEKKLKEMESVIDLLHDKVKYWQRLYQSKSNEMIHLENKYNQLIQNSTSQDSIDSNDLIDNFKPLKSVPLLPVKNGLPSNSTKPNLVPIRPIPLLPTRKQKPKCSNPEQKHNTTTPSSCGFCDDSISCICNELTTTATKTEEEENQSDLIITASIPSKPITTTIAPMTIAQLTCSSDPHTCTKCSDINQTCIRPTDTTGKNNSNNSNNIPNEIDFTTYK